MNAPQDTLLHDLFGEPPVPDVPGLRYLPRWIEPDHELHLLTEIDAQPWRTAIKRRTQHYGYSYEPAAPRSQKPVRLGDLPDWLLALAQLAHAEGLIASVPDNAVINEYLPGQGIAPHLDLPAFGPTVLSLSLGSDCVMDVVSEDAERAHALLLERRSLLVLDGDARSRWRHGIAHRGRDRVHGISFERERRVSITLRTTLPP